VGSSRAGAFPQIGGPVGACTGSVPLNACRVEEGSPPCERRARAYVRSRAREGTPRSPRTHLHAALARCDGSRRETRARGEKSRAHATTRDQHENDSRDPSRGRAALASILAPEVKIIAIESTKDAASRGHELEAKREKTNFLAISESFGISFTDFQYILL